MAVKRKDPLDRQVPTRGIKPADNRMDSSQGARRPSAPTTETAAGQAPRIIRLEAVPHGVT